MKIGYFIRTFPVVTETFILNQITGMIDRGHHVVIFTRIKKDFQQGHHEVVQYNLEERTRLLEDVPKNYLKRLFIAFFLIGKNWNTIKIGPIFRSLNVFRFGRKAASLRYLYDTIQFMKEELDVIHCQFGTDALESLPYQKIGALPEKVVVSFRGHDATKFVVQNPGVYKELFKVGTLFLPVSKALKQCLIAEGCPEDRITVHHSGIDLNKFPYAAPADGGRRTVRLLTIGRLVEMKGIEYAIRAVAAVLKKGDSVDYTIVGDGILKEHLENLIQKLQIKHAVTITGWMKHDAIIKKMISSHMLITPSVTAADGDQEGIPNVVKEAMALGIPVVSTLHGGIPELVEDGVSGFLVKEQDVAAMAEKIGFLIHHPEICQEFSRKGRKHVEMFFDIERLNDRLVDLYRQSYTSSSQHKPACE